MIDFTGIDIISVIIIVIIIYFNFGTALIFGMYFFTRIKLKSIYY